MACTYAGGSKEFFMLLDTVSPGAKVRLMAVKTGASLQRRLAAMGLVPGVELLVLENNRNGPFLIAVNGSRLMLGRGMVKKIAVV